MNYDKDIIKILKEAGTQGLSVRKIVMHVYNANNSFFDDTDVKVVARYVYSFLQRNSKGGDSMVEHTGQKGIYRLNMNSRQTSQLMLQFTEISQEDSVAPVPEDKSLSLFD